MGLRRGNRKIEDFEWITNRDLVDSAHLVMGGIDLDPASSKKANEFVNAKEFFVPTDDGLNEQKWHGNVYLFPPHHSYFWHKQSQRWKPTRGLSPTLTAGHAIWWRTLKRKWLEGEIEQAIYFSNYIDMTMYCQDIFDHPVCILKGRPTLIRNYFNEERLQKYKTGVSLAVYLQPKTDIEKATEFFVDLYSEKGRVIA
tara:strand:- start:1226 stop:1819 length:594 start_codon:yes stop_codon:yes gene_type:complete